MTKIKVGKYIFIFFIGLIAAYFVGIGGNGDLKAGLPATVEKTEVNFEKHHKELEDSLAAGLISRHEFDSLSDILRAQKARLEAVNQESHIPDKMPEWVSKLGIIEPVGMKYEPMFSDYTSVENPSEGFNSVSLVYTGTYETAIAEAYKIAVNKNLSIGGDFESKGNPAKKKPGTANSGISYLNYSLGKTDKDFLISVQVEHSGQLTIMVTDNKQLNERLLSYEPLNNRQNSAAKRKKM